jgi:hypothetical protein
MQPVRDESGRLGQNGKKGMPMGREAQGMVQFRGQSGAGKLLLEPEGLILRGDLRGRIARAEIGTAAVDGEDLVIATPDGPLRVTLGAKEAGLWLKALARPLPSLAEKLGLSASRPAFALTPLSDAALRAAAEGCITADQTAAAMMLAELPDRATFDAILPRLTGLPVWLVTVKGKASALPDDALRPVLRGLGFIDSKSCAVSNRMTATRYGPKGASPQR